jgi:16S rRNA (guanine1207-N2)-methyltransferase
VIGLSFKKRNPSLEVVLADVDAFALRSAQLNSLRLALPAEILNSDGLASIEGRFDFIISNPPFHQGKNTDYQFARRLFIEAKQHLVKDGQLWLIANRHLGYEEWAQEAFDQVDVMVQEKGFKLICAQKPR